MKQNASWRDLKPSTWRTLLPGLSDRETETLDRRVGKEGPGAFSHLQELVENEQANDELRYRAMGWLVSLYGDPEIDKDAVVKVLRNVVRSNLERPHSQPRRDALMALARLQQIAWDVEPDLGYLLELAADRQLGRDVTEDVLLALGETRSPEAVGPLARGILEAESAGLRRKLAEQLQAIAAVEWREKANAFLELIELHPIRSSDVDAGAIVRALGPSRGEDLSRRLAELGNFIIERSRNRDERVAGAFAKLLIETHGGEQIQAGHRINQHEQDHNIPSGELEKLRIAVGGEPAVKGPGPQKTARVEEPASKGETPIATQSPSAPIIDFSFADDASPRPRFAGYAADTSEEPDDLLHVDRDVNAICAILAARDVPLPLSLGLFGDWGSGKTFFMNMMHTRIEALADSSKGKSAQETAYCEHVVQIRFNAWHYIDANLWASLVTFILDELHAYMKGEPADPWTKAVNNLEGARGLHEEAKHALVQAEATVTAAEQALQEAQQNRTRREQEIEADYNALKTLLTGRMRDQLDKVAKELGWGEAVMSVHDLSRQIRDLRTRGRRLHGASGSGS